MQDLYRNRDFIPDFDAVMEETAARSRSFAASARMIRDVAYGTRPRERRVARAAAALSASSSPFSMRPALSAASKRNDGISARASRARALPAR